MSLNKFMHPRNLYKTPSNFKELAIKFPDFRQFAKQDLSGKVRIDFKDANALRTLTRTLLLKDFKLEVEIPPDRLVPTLPLRLNYLLWIEDIIKQNFSTDETVRGIDIGTGASCVYPLLAARHFKWQMLATEVDPKSFDVAKKNVDVNHLQEQITVKKVDDANVLCGVVDPDADYTFCMCNPPFFSSEEELIPETVSRSPNRPPPRNAASGSVTELVSPGGECVFVQKIIDDSVKLKKQIRFYSVMLGHKSSINTVRDYLKECGITNISTTAFCQGHTTRWGVAWTHDPGIILLTDNPTSSVRTNNKPFSFGLSTTLTLKEVVDKVTVILSELQIKSKMEKTQKEIVIMEITAETNTWSNQRRKRRLQHQQEIKIISETSTSEDNNLDSEETSSKTLHQEILQDTEVTKSELTELKISDAEEIKANLLPVNADETGSENSCTKVTEVSKTDNNETSNLKRKIQGDGNEKPIKKMKLDSENSNVCKINNNGPLLIGSLVIRNVSKNIVFDLFYVRGTGGKNSAHQVLQFLKNKFILRKDK